ncbi:MAG: hypothetical protein WDN44_08500 [Sphingomonas sp.]
MTQKTQIVVVGGGAGGLELVRRLGARFGRARHDIILVDRTRTHVWKPLLHEGRRRVARRQSRRGRLSQPLPPLGLSLFPGHARGDRPRRTRGGDRATARRGRQRTDRAPPHPL